MSKSLIITEKPSVARDIVAALGGFTEDDGFWESEEHVVTFSVGHLLELPAPEDVDPKYKRWTLDTLPILPEPEQFKLKQKSGASERLRTIKKLLQRDDVSKVINACDAGREGELIFREILEFLNIDKPTLRLWLQSMTTQSIRDGFSNLAPGEDYDGLGAAAACRSRSDWLIGMNATRALTRRFKGRREKTAWSAGRVQTPTLALLVGRELEILAHIPRAYWHIDAKFRAADHEYTGAWFDPNFNSEEADRESKDDRIFAHEAANAVVEAVTGKPAVASETRKPSRETAPPLFDLTSLQREGNRRFGWSARRTLNAAQRCYESHKVLTYPRTDSRALPNDYREKVNEALQTFAQGSPFQAEAQELLDKGLENTERTFDDSKVSDHFAIIPTGRVPEEPLTGDDGRLFDLVARRFLGSFYPPAIWNRVERKTEVAGHVFRSRSRTLDEPGWRAVLGQTEQEEQALPPLISGQTTADDVDANTLDIELSEDKTRPPARITEARLLSLMESAGQYVEDEEHAAVMRDKGIGTPATRADIIENLIAKGYLARVGKALRPTVKGVRLVDVLKRIKADRLASPELTGQLEFQLHEVENGSRTAEEFMKEVVDYTKSVVDVTCTFDYVDLYDDNVTFGNCPLCERAVVERSWFYRCIEVPGVEGDDDCPMRIWKDKSGRYIDHNTVRVLLDKAETDEMEGFTSRDGRMYNARLTLEEGEVQLHAIQGSWGERVDDSPEYEVNEDPLGPCPTGCGSFVIETPTHFICKAGMEKAAVNAEKARVWESENNAPDAKRKKRYKIPEDEKHCPMILPRTVCKREIARDEAVQYVKEQKTELLSDFTSRFGRPFGAMLFLKENGRHGFEFAKRPGKADSDDAKEGATGKKASKKASKKTARKKAAKKTTKKKAAGKKTAKKTTRKKTTKKVARASVKKASAEDGDD
ncbi:MAG: DNA topoisomerase III [bacterium]|nr:DNA topoisomerase III [bacterium]